MLRCYGRAVIGLTEAKQRSLFTKAGVAPREGSPIYFDTARSFPDRRAAAIRSLRDGSKDELGVARLHVLAQNRKDLREVLAAVKAKGSTIRELDTGRVLHPDDCADAILDAVNWWGSRNKRFGDLTVEEAASLGGKTLARLRKKSRMPKAAAFEIWRRKDLNTDEALALINADKNYGRTWSMSAAYQHLGPRGAFAGRRPRKK